MKLFDQGTIPPVMAISVPASAGPREYGGKVLGDKILLPYNKSVLKAFSDIKEKPLVIMSRKDFFQLPTI
jgi:hypothetical protein